MTFFAGEIYEEGQGIKRDYEQAQKYYRMAAGKGLAEAKYKLGMMYKNGKGLEEDWLKAVEMILEAADQGSVRLFRVIIQITLS